MGTGPIGVSPPNLRESYLIQAIIIGSWGQAPIRVWGLTGTGPIG